MKLFNLLKKDIKEETKVSYDVSNSDYIVLGACCKKSSDTFNNLKQALIELNIVDTAVNVGDTSIIASYGVMSTPSLVIKQKVVTSGRYLSVDDIKKQIESFGK